MELAVPQRNSVQTVALTDTTAAESRKRQEPVKLLDLHILLLERIARHLLPMTLSRGRKFYSLYSKWNDASVNTDNNVLWTSQKLPQSLLNFADASPLLAEACARMLGPRGAWLSPTFDGHLEYFQALHAFSTHVKCVNASFLHSKLHKRHRKKYFKHMQRQDVAGLQIPRIGNILTSIAYTTGLKLHTLDISFISATTREDNLMCAILLAHRNSLQTISISTNPTTVSAFKRARQYFRLPCLRQINFRMDERRKLGKVAISNKMEATCELLLSVFYMAGAQSGQTNGITGLSLNGVSNTKLAAMSLHVQLAAYLENLQKLTVAYWSGYTSESCEQLKLLVCACPKIVELDIMSIAWSQEQVNSVLSSCVYLERVSLRVRESYDRTDSGVSMISAFHGKLHTLSLDPNHSFGTLQDPAIGETLVELDLNVMPSVLRLVVPFLRSCRQLVALSLDISSHLLEDEYARTIFGVHGWAKFACAVSNMEFLERLSLRQKTYYTGDSTFDWLSDEEDKAKMESLKSIIWNRGRHLKRLWVSMDAGKGTYLESVNAFLSILQGMSHVCSTKLEDLEVDFSSERYYFGYLEGDQKTTLTHVILNLEQAIERIKTRTGPFVSIVTGTVLDGLRSMLASFDDYGNSEQEYFVSFEND